MTELSSFEISLILIIIVLAVIVAGLLLYLLRRLKSRRAKLLSELEDRPELNQDRAFNRLAMARREAEILSGQGVDVQRAQALIAESQGAFDLHHYEAAYKSAQSAHEALVNARRQSARSTGSPLPTSGGGSSPTTSATLSSAPPARIGGAGPSPAAEPSPRPTIPKYRAESQFQIRLLTDELQGLPARRAKDPTGVQAASFRRQASEAFDRNDYVEAFRLALRGRRALGGTLESLPATGPGVAPAPAAGNGSGRPSDIATAAENVASGERCPDCGYPTLPGDAFCRGCGRPKAALTCPSCGAPRGAQEPYCGRCGARFP